MLVYIESYSEVYSFCLYTNNFETALGDKWYWSNNWFPTLGSTDQFNDRTLWRWKIHHLTGVLTHTIVGGIFWMISKSSIRPLAQGHQNGFISLITWIILTEINYLNWIHPTLEWRQKNRGLCCFFRTVILYVTPPLILVCAGEGEKVNGLTSLPTTLYVHDHLNWDKVLPL